MDQPLYRTQILLNPEYHQTLMSIAARERRSLSDLVSEIVHQNLSERRKKALEDGTQALRSDYRDNPELTAFTSLDSESFYG
ncbi:MAG: hypothetical protein JW908_02490 [Anaerolineales bacterium]|nr:hypothetical protein [Anaerolineales bacterium]